MRIGSGATSGQPMPRVVTFCSEGAPSNRPVREPVVGDACSRVPTDWRFPHMVSDLPTGRAQHDEAVPRSGWRGARQEDWVILQGGADSAAMGIARSQIPFFAPTRNARQVAAAVPGVVPITDLRLFQHHARLATCVAIWCPSCPAGSAFWSWLREFRARHPFVQTVLVASFDVASARALAAEPPAEVVWMHEAREELPKYIASANGLKPDRILASFGTYVGSSAEIYAAGISRLCDLSCSPIVRVQDLLRRCGHSEVNVRAAWRQRWASPDSVDR